MILILLQTTLAQHPELNSRALSADDLPALHQIFATSYATLAEALAILPNNVHVELHILYPSQIEETQLRLGSTLSINDFADGVLKVVFDHARSMRVNSDGFLRSIVFSSFNSDICTALNWKQPNCEW
jgi:CDK inhibitor PHO81